MSKGHRYKRKYFKSTVTVDDMLNLAWFFLAVLTCEGVRAYDDDFTFVDVWQEIENEIEHAVCRLRNEDDKGYAKMVARRCEKLERLVGDEVFRLENETKDHEVGDIIFKRMMYDFREARDALARVETLGDGLELRSGLIYNLEIVDEYMEQLVYIGKTYCPQLRAVLRTLLVDFLKCAQDLAGDSGILEQTVIIYESPKCMVSQIEVITQELSATLQKLSRVETIRMAFRGFTRYVEEIVQKLDSEAIPNVEVKSVTQKLHQMLGTLARLISREDTSARYFQTVIPLQLDDVTESFQLLVSGNGYSMELKTFLNKIIYYYYYSIKQTHFEVQNAYKSAFYGCASYNNSENGFESPSTIQFRIKTPKELVIEIQRLSQGSKPTSKFAQLLECLTAQIDNEIATGRLMQAEKAMMTLSQDFKAIKSKMETATGPYPFVEMAASELYNLVIAESMQNNGFEHLLVKEICLEFLDFLRDANSATSVSAKDLALKILKSSSTESFNNLGNNALSSYCFRELVQVLEYVTDKIDKEVKIGHLPHIGSAMAQFSLFLKVVATGLQVAKYDFATVAQMVSTELYKVVADAKVQGFEELFLKDVCFQFLSSFQNLAYEIGVFREEYN